jgi:hypothetical protein
VAHPQCTQLGALAADLGTILVSLAPDGLRDTRRLDDQGPRGVAARCTPSPRATGIGAALPLICTATLTPPVELIRHRVFAAERIHGDDTTVPMLSFASRANPRRALGPRWPSCDSSCRSRSAAKISDTTTAWHPQLIRGDQHGLCSAIRLGWRDARFRRILPLAAYPGEGLLTAKPRQLRVPQ